jgi:chemotaxis protein CheX
MPGKSGLELAREIRALSQDVPIVIVTTEAEKSRVVEAIQAGVTDYVVKPFATEVLHGKLERLAQEASSRFRPTAAEPPHKVDYINPFLASIISVFFKMLSVELVRDAPFLRKQDAPQYDVTGLIGLMGTPTGTVSLSLPADFALSITERLLGARPPEIDAQVVDAIGEVTNIVAGAARAHLADQQLRFGLATVIIGAGCRITYPSSCTPISIPFRSAQGPLLLEVGILA